MSDSHSIFELPAQLPEVELFEPIVHSDSVLIERIISCGHTTPKDEWYDQERDEWVILLQGEAELTYQDGTIQRLQVGNYIFLPAHHLHRVSYTSTEPPCIWLAIHGNLA